MKEEVVRNLNHDKFRTCIYKMREVVNKISYSINEMQPSINRLILRRQLDELMIEYLDLVKINVEI